MEEKARMDGRRWQRRMKMGRDVGGYVGIESLVCERFVCCFGEEKRKLEKKGGILFLRRVRSLTLLDTCHLIL